MMFTSRSEIEPAFTIPLQPAASRHLAQERGGTYYCPWTEGRRIKDLYRIVLGLVLLHSCQGAKYQNLITIYSMSFAGLGSLEIESARQHSASLPLSDSLLLYPSRLEKTPKSSRKITMLVVNLRLKQKSPLLGSMILNCRACWNLKFMNFSQLERISKALHGLRMSLPGVGWIQNYCETYYAAEFSDLLYTILL
jgi:hypothetical protein